MAEEVAVHTVRLSNKNVRWLNSQKCSIVQTCVWIDTLINLSLFIRSFLMLYLQNLGAQFINLHHVKTFNLMVSLEEEQALMCDLVVEKEGA